MGEAYLAPCFYPAVPVKTPHTRTWRCLAIFVDEIWLEVSGGRGGNGALSFRREKYIPRGGPDGGDGGDGGSVFLVVDPSKNSFLDLRYRRRRQASSGADGGTKKRQGRRGADLLVPVPPGTLVRDEQGRLLADLTLPHQKVRVAAGGEGGRGNSRFATSRHQAPRHAEKGLPGEERKIYLELKLLAQVGLVGFPNAGKSTLLARISSARPKVGDYPFTTLAPQLGIVETGDEESFVVADLPGLITGAHRGAGLGHRFLRHVERNLLLLLVIDLAPGAHPQADEAYRGLIRELGLYDSKLAAYPRIIAGNKIDLTGADEGLESLRCAVEEGEKDEKIFAISAATGAGVRELLHALAAEVRRLAALPQTSPAVPEADTGPEIPQRRDGFYIEKESDCFRVSGSNIEKLVARTDFANEESLQRFQRHCRRCGLESELKRMGIKAGDRVCIGEEEFYYET